MRSAAVFLLMLFCSIRNSRSEFSVPADDRTRTEAHAFRDLGVLWDEVRGLKDLVLSLKGEEVERRQELRSVESRLRDREMVAEQQKQSLVEVQVAVGHQIDNLKRTLLTEQASVLRSKVEELEVQSKAQAAVILDLQTRINTSESTVEQLRRKNTVLAAELPFLQTRLRASENTVEQLRKKDAVLTGRMCNTESLMEDLMGKISEIQDCNSSAVMVSEVVVLEDRLKINLDKLKVNIEGQVHELEIKLDSSQLHLEELSAAAENRLNEAERQQDELRKHNTELVSRLRSSEKQLDDLKMLSREMEIRLRSTEGHLDQFKDLTAELLSRLRSNEEQLEDLKTTNTDMEVRLGSAEGKLDQLKNQTTVLEVRLRASEKPLEDLKTENSGDLENRLRSTEEHLDQLKSQSAVQFSQVESRLADGLNRTTGLVSRLKFSEKHLEDLKIRNTDMEVRMTAIELRLDQFENHTADLVSRLRSREEQIEDLKTTNADMEVRLGSTEGKLVHLKNHTAVLEVKLRISETQQEEQKAENSELGSSLRSSEQQLEDLKLINSELMSRLRSSEEQLEDLKTANKDLDVRLGSTEGKLGQLKNHTTVLEVRLRASERQLEKQRAENSAHFSWLESKLTDELNRTAEFKTKLSAVAYQLNVKKEQLDDLKRQSLVRAAELAAAQGNTKDELKVAFSAGLTDSGIVGPFDKETTLTFTKIIANIGQGYNTSAGVFTAPVRGLYFFSFTAADYFKGYMGLYLYRNDQPIIFSLDLNDHGGYASITSALVLQLDEGDRVRIALPASYRLYDDSRNFTVFSGFLLFPV